MSGTPPIERNAWWAVAEAIVGPPFRSLCPMRVRGIEAIPERQGTILASNHVSPLDPIALGLAARPRGRIIRFLAAAELFEGRWMSFALSRLGAVPIHRGAHDVHAFAAAEWVLRSGGLVGIFPEGRLNVDQRLLRFHTGAARLAMATGAPIIPAAVWGTQRRWHPGGRLDMTIVRRTPVAVLMGPSITPGPGPRRGVQSLTDVLRATIERLEELARTIVEDGHGGDA